jgi:signal transduction histidine kinase
MAPDPLLGARELFAFAHDLRTHLRTVLTRIQLVQRGAAAQLSEDDQALLQEAAKAASDIQGLLNAMMAFTEAATPSAGHMRLSLMIRGVVMERKPVVSSDGGAIEVVPGAADPDVPSELDKVLKEILVNASKFRHPQRPLRICISTQMLDDASVEIAVTDNGIGVPGEFLDRIFTPFQRLHGRDEYPGHGLGLATSQRRLTAEGGSIRAESAGEHGLTIRIASPIRVA